MTKQSSKGLSLLEAVIAIGLVGLVVFFFGPMILRGLGVFGMIQNMSNLESIKLGIIERFDCDATFGVTASTALPLSCSAYSSFGSFVPARRDGQPLFSASQTGWQVQAKCDGEEVVFSATRVGKNPVTGRAYKKTKIANDMFNGHSEFCRTLFSSSSSCPTNPYRIQLGRENGKPQCCRLVKDDVEGSGYNGVPGPADHPANPGYNNAGVAFYAIAACTQSEFLYTGGGECTDFSSSNATPHLHQSGMNIYTGNSELKPHSWIVDCHAYDTGLTDFRHSSAKAWAICCPY